VSFNQKNIATSEMNSHTVAAGEFLNKDVNSSEMIIDRLYSEDFWQSYFNIINDSFHLVNFFFTEDTSWYKRSILESESEVGYIVHGDLYWDDLEHDGQIDMLHQTQDTGFIADIYNSTHETWSGCGYGWDQGGPDSIETQYYIPFERFFHEVNHGFDIVESHFGSPESILEGAVMTEDFSDAYGVSAELFTEQTPTTVNGWTERGI
jgi:hypothetical protein